MNNKYHVSNDECVDLDLGRELWRLEDPQTNPKQRKRLEAHLSICAACRLQVAHQQAVADGLREGSLHVRAAGPFGGPTMFAAGISALAAGLCLIFMQPLTKPGIVERSNDDATHLLAPVSGQVVVDRTPKIRWTVMEGARAYDVTVRDTNGDLAWRERTENASTSPQPTAQLERGHDYRIRVNAVPAFAAGEPLRGSFRVGTWSEFVRYRLAVARPWQWLLVGLGLALTAVGVLRRMSFRRHLPGH